MTYTSTATGGGLSAGDVVSIRSKISSESFSFGDAKRYDGGIALVTVFVGSIADTKW